MKRRTAIKQLFILAGGLAIATSCNNDRSKASIALNNVDFSKQDEDFLAELTEAIIPKTDTPGAKELNLHLFVMKMVDDCHSPEDIQDFIKGLEKAKTVQGKSSQEIQAYLSKLDKEDRFFSILKSRTIMGYENSMYVMTEKLVYQLVPGKYDGQVKLKA